MLVLITVENGVKKAIPLTADAGAGNPVGSLLHTYKKSNPSGYLFCDGSTFDQTKYPLLYAYLGTNVLPDYRECVEVGAEQNATDSIATHDVYTEGQFKDDQLQDHTHNLSLSEDGNYPLSRAYTTGGNQRYGLPDSMTNDDFPLWASTIHNGRHGSTTHGKQKAVFVYIKATSGLSENAQDNVINTLNEQRSYSTEEINTGKKWIDGKPIYRKSGYVSSISSVPYIVDSVLTDTYVDVLIESKASMKYYSSKVVVYGYTSATDRFSLSATSSGLTLNTNFSLADIVNGFYWTVEYTKTN